MHVCRFTIHGFFVHDPFTIPPFLSSSPQVHPRVLSRLAIVRSPAVVYEAPLIPTLPLDPMLGKTSPRAELEVYVWQGPLIQPYGVHHLWMNDISIWEPQPTHTCSVEKSLYPALSK